MVAAICYAWLIENRAWKSKGEGDEDGCIFVPVMNVRRERMWKKWQAAWLFHHSGLDATSLLFADEVDLESLMMDGQLSILVVGQDILRTNGEVGSQCTIMTDNYCEDAYDQTDNSFFEALRHNYGKPPNDGGYDNGVQMEHMIPERKSTSISCHEVFAQNSDKNTNDARNAKINTAPPKSAKPNPSPVKSPPAAPEASRGKNKFFLAKWFGFGSK